MMREEQVVLVTPEGNEIGTMGKQEAHEKGVLHKAFSIIIFNSDNEMLIQQRAHSKYHWAGIWSNTCCSHPREGESYYKGALRRLREELGFETKISEAFSFVYKATDESSGLTEHELDYVFFGVYDGEINFNKEEVNAVRWITAEDLYKEVEEEPEKFSFWFKIILEEIKKRNLLPQ